MSESTVFCEDCMSVMARYPDGFFDLAVVDPPYGAGGGVFAGETRFGGRFDKYKPDAGGGHPIPQTGHHGSTRYGDKKSISWDHAPGEDYFRELFRVSKAQIIWGGNFFPLPPCRCFLTWVKSNIPENFTMSQAEYAWTSLNDNAKIFTYPSTRPKGDVAHWHPTEKPQALYAWIYREFAKPGYKILDTHLGSGTNRRAAWDAGLDFVGCEISAEYYRKQEADFDAYTSQLSLDAFTSQLSLLEAEQ